MSRPPWDDLWMKIAGVVSERSLCDGDQVGAVIASSTNRLVSVGYNNPPAGFDHLGETCRLWCQNQVAREPVGYEEDPNQRFTAKHMLTMLEYTHDETIIEVDSTTTYRLRADDPETPDDMRKIMQACGFRPVFPGKKDSNVACPTLHAEANALSVCDRSQREGGTMYVTSAPCFPCAKLIANSGLARLVYLDSERGRDRVAASEIDPLKFMHDTGIKVMVDGCVDCGDQGKHNYAGEDWAC